MVQGELQHKIINTAWIEAGGKSGDGEQSWPQALQTQASQNVLGRQEAMKTHISLSKDNLLLSDSALWEITTALNDNS